MGGLESKTKGTVHYVQLAFVIIAMGVSGVRIVMAELPMTRADTMALGMGGKSLIIIGYQLLTEHVRKLRRFASLKANLILNCAEIVFWAVVVGLLLQVSMSMCTTAPLITSCWLAWVVIGASATVCLLSAYAAILSYREFRDSRRAKSGNGKFSQLSETYEDSYPLRPVSPSYKGYATGTYLQRPM